MARIVQGAVKHSGTLLRAGVAGGALAVGGLFVVEESDRRVRQKLAGASHLPPGHPPAHAARLALIR